MKRGKTFKGRVPPQPFKKGDKITVEYDGKRRVTRVKSVKPLANGSEYVEVEEWANAK